MEYRLSVEIYPAGKHLQEKKKELPIISKEEIRQISLETPLPLDEKELELFLKYHHEIRALVYFEDLPNYIVLDTQWLADAFKCIVTADKFRPGQGRRLGTKAWADLNDKGLLHSQVLEYIIKTNKHIFKFEKELNDYILNIMEKFDIIIRPNKSDAAEDSPKYYVPCMVKTRPELINIYEMFKVANDNKSAWLCFEFNFLPQHLINHLIASLSREYEKLQNILTVTKRKLLFSKVSLCLSINRNKQDYKKCL
ncbi:unnamed protein product [Mytilus edulis]|uniref:COR domain-containing protein n=1 Tax=Mytilus edulis TaxID=6550 RepID=A0A8S3TS43_MYTED|nr:unnamed protein product [Mytilus edulis]